MQKTDIGVVAVMYAICAYFYYMTTQLKEESQTYPKFTIALLFGLTTLYLVNMLVNAKRHGVESGADKVFAEFKPLQFFICVALVFAYLILMKYFGFYISTVIFMFAVLLFLRVPILQSVISVAAIVALVYLAFTTFLGVKLPVGEIIKSLK